MKVLFVTAESGPYVSVGGLSQVSYFLTAALAKQKVDVKVFTPKFGAMDATAPKKNGWELKQEMEGIDVPFTNGNWEGKSDYLRCNIKSYYNKKQGVKTYFLENREYYELRANVFGYKDDHIRFALLSKGCLEWLKRLKETGSDWWPDVIHCNDWHSAYLIELARTSDRYEELLKRVPIVLTVHNFGFQGNYEFNYCDPKDRDELNKPLAPLLSPKLVKQNALKRGVKYADEVNTVSPTHAREVMRKEYGEGMEKLMVKYRSKVSGIINGLDYKEFDPAKDPLLFRRFTLKNWQERREENKAKLQELFELPVKSEKMLLGYVGRLANQKGVGLIIEAMKKLLIERDDIQLVVLGGGDESYRRSFDKLGQLYPDKVGLHLLSNFELPRKIFTGVDALILPSLYEPGGIVALEAMRYGAVPLVRRTGGLNDVIQDFEPNRKKGNGFSFESKDAWGLYGAIMQALTTYQNHKLWAKLVLNCLKTDYSWEKSAREYQRWYRAAIKKRKKKLTGVPHRAYTKLKPMVVR